MAYWQPNLVEHQIMSFAMNGIWELIKYSISQPVSESSSIWNSVGLFLWSVVSAVSSSFCLVSSEL